MMPAKSNCFEGSSESDGFYWKEVTLPNGTPGKLIASGEYGESIEESFRNVVKTLLDSGNNLIVDYVVDGKKEMEVWKKLLVNHKSCLVGTFCNLETLVERERNRNERMLGSAAEQYFRAHKGIEYDIEVETDVRSVKECAKSILDQFGQSN